MSTIRFVLRTDKPNRDGLFPIELVYQISGQRGYFRTKEKLHEFNWDKNNQRALFYDKEARKLAKFTKSKIDQLLTTKEAGEVNNKLAAFRQTIADIEKKFELNKELYSVDTVIEQLKGNRYITKKKAPTNQLFDFIDQYIVDHKTTREAGSLKVYGTLKKHLQAYQTAKGKKVTFDSIDYSFFQSFQDYLITTKTKFAPDGLSNVSAAKQLSTVKTFLNYARMQGITVSDKYKDFPIKRENLEVIALTKEEFHSIYDLNLKNNKRLDQVRDTLCFSIVTGLRYSDLAQLKRENIKNDGIRLTIKKTKDSLLIPLNPYAKLILSKYAESLRPLPIISNQKTNQFIKEICELAKINDPVQIVRFRGSRREENTYPKWQLISIHTGRKTFCTLALESGASAEEVMQLSGHKDYKSFKRYIAVTEQRSRVTMAKAFGIIHEPKLKAV